MKETLADIKSKLESGNYSNEEHVRLSLVARVLQKLDWNIWEPREVNSEFVVVPHEDKTRVDVALFLKPTIPSVFIEIKAVGQIQGRLPDIERQVRDYNRNNTALFSIITDGREWRFYHSQTGGEFSQKFFESFDILKDNLEDVELSLLTFLKKSEIANENALRAANSYLQLNNKQRAMEDCLPEARRLVNEPPFPSLPGALVSLVGVKGFVLQIEEAVEFIKGAAERKTPTPYHSPPQVTEIVTGSDRKGSSGGRRELNPENADNLFHTKIIQGHFAGTSVSQWNELVECAMRAAVNSGVPYSFLQNIGSAKEGNPSDPSFHKIGGTQLWIRGMDANQSWKWSLALAKRVRAEIEVVVLWREKEQAAHPGEEGLLRWSPAGR